MKVFFVLCFISCILLSVFAYPGKPSWAGNPHQGGGGSSAVSQAQSQALNVNIIANPDGTFGVQQSAAQANAQAAAGSGSVSSGPGNSGNKGNKGNRGNGAGSAAQSQSQTVNVNIVNAPQAVV